MKSYTKGITYENYVLALTVPDGAVIAWNFPGALVKFVKDAKSLLAEISEQVNISFEDLMTAFKSKELFQIFKAVGFSIAKIVKAIQGFAHLVTLGLFKVLAEIEKTEQFQHFKTGVMRLDEVLDQYPLIKKLAGPALAGLLLWCWLNSAFIGDPALDLNINYIVQAFQGHFTAGALFASQEGMAMMATFAFGFTGISVHYLAANVGNILLALLYTGAHKMKDPAVFKPLKERLQKARITSGSTMKKIETKDFKATTIEAGALDAVRASKLLTMLGIKSAELMDTSEGNLVFGVHDFYGAVGPLTRFYGAPKNESNVSWGQKRLIWSVPEVNGQVMLMQVGKMGPLLIFKQL